ncbi:lipopolysaccharide biosynthesis protein [Acinetobacter pseudolwoffii]|uniref:lipopolysaccharide biosynthesis protein n=1 Tax=Acinetobacter pseudolwoffii TaxID=2053287 RepID=UPI000C232020|nr:oligosaccharide flippase family protein [Acinetobacter pseudolwoffii]PJI29647.1 polysaccharide biosynthesis protein [Acinetobacter pseudolwoffii]
MNKKKLLGYAIGPIGGGVLGFISLPIITWFYSVEDVGRISMLQVFTSFSILFFCLGLDQAYVREYHDTNNKPLLLKTVVFPSLALCLLILASLFIIDPYFISYWLYDIESVYLSLITMACFLIALLSRFLSLILRMQERAFAFSMSQLLPKILLLFFILFTVWWGYSRDSYNLLTANALTLYFAFIVYAWNTKKDWLPAINMKIDRQHFKAYLIFSLPLLVGGLASWGLNTVDKLFLRGMASYSELGIYSVAMSLAGVATMIAGIFNTIWAPMVYKWVSMGDIDFQKIDRISEYVLAAIYFVVVASGLFSWVIPYFLPQEYEKVQILITICLIGPLFYTLSETTAVGIAITRKTKFSMYASIIAMIVGVMGSYLLVPILGASGAAISLAVSFWVFYILRTEFSKMVWREVPYIKSYLVSSIILFLAIVNVFIPIDNMYRYLLWSSAFVIGIYIFRNLGLSIFNNFRKGK